MDDFAQNLALLDLDKLALIGTGLAVVAASWTRKRKDRRQEPPRQERRRRPRSCGTRPWLLRRPLYGQYETLMAELQREDRPGFRNFQRVDPELFAELVEKVGARIERQTTFWREPLSPGLRLAITLRYLATGNSYTSLQYSFRVANNTISQLIPETCEVLYEVLADEYLKCPTTPDEWSTVAEGFAERWQFHNCVGALDGKHIAIKNPKQSGSYFFNYKGFYSTVLMALVDAEYRFIYVDIGANGRSSDGGVFQDTPLRERLDEESLGLPPPAPMPNDDEPVPFCLVGDDAFPLRSWMMKPYSQRNLTHDQRVFNYRLSRARRVVENAFGVLAHRFRCLLTTMQQKPETVDRIVLAACVLHNLLRTRYPNRNMHHFDAEDPDTHQLIPGAWREDEQVLLALQGMKGNNATKSAKSQRDYRCGYINSPAGSVSWQEGIIH